MPSTSKSQQRFFGLLMGIKKGQASGSSKAKKAAASMSEGQIKDFLKLKKKKK